MPFIPLLLCLLPHPSFHFFISHHTFSFPFPPLILPTSVVDPNKLNLDPDPGFWPNLDPDPG